MKKILIGLVVVLMLVLFVPGKAQAAPTCQQSLLGLVCVSVSGGSAVVTGPGINLSVPVPTVTVPGPTVTLPGRTVTVPGPTVTASGTTITRTQIVNQPGRVGTVTVTKNNNTTTSATLTQRPSPSTSVVTHTVTASPSSGHHKGILPHTPAGAAVAGSLLGVIVGISVALVSMFIIYRRGRKEGEKATVKEFLGDVRGIRKQIK